MNDKSDTLPAVTPVPRAMVAGGRPLPIVPTSLDEVWRIAKAICVADMAPKDMRSPEKVSVAILHGLEIGLTPMIAMQRIAIVNGRPTLWGDGAMALVLASGLVDMLDETMAGEGDARVATCRTKRKGWNTVRVSTFSVADARKAGLWGKGVWTQYPDRMLAMRARGFLLRDVYADVLGGMYLREEVGTGGDEPRDRPQRPSEPFEEGVVTEVAEESAQENAAEAAGEQKDAPDEPPVDYQAMLAELESLMEAAVSIAGVEEAWDMYRKRLPTSSDAMAAGVRLFSIHSDRVMQAVKKAREPVPPRSASKQGPKQAATPEPKQEQKPLPPEPQGEPGRQPEGPESARVAWVAKFLVETRTLKDAGGSIADFSEMWSQTRELREMFSWPAKSKVELYNEAIQIMEGPAK